MKLKTLNLLLSVLLFSCLSAAQKAQPGKHRLKGYGTGQTGVLMDLSWEATTQTIEGNTFEDGRLLGFNITYDSDLESWIDWERMDNLQQFWYIDKLVAHMFMFYRLTFNLNLLIAYLKIEVPLKIFDFALADMYLIWMKESEIVCLGAKSTYKIIDVLPVIKENTNDCSYSLISRIRGTRTWASGNGLAHIFECRGTVTETGTLYDTVNDNPQVVVNAPWFIFDFEEESVIPLPYFGFTLFEDFRELFGGCFIEGEWVNVKY